MIIESLSTLVPLHHDIFMGYVELVEYQIQHLHIIAIGFAMVVSELVGWKFPVAHYDEWFFFCIVAHIVCPCT